MTRDGALAVGSVKAGEAVGRDAEFVALWVLHYGPALAGYLVFADDRDTEPISSVTASGSGLTKSMWTRFLACFGSGTLLKYQAGSFARRRLRRWSEQAQRALRGLIRG